MNPLALRTKICFECKKKLSVDTFTKDRHKADGLNIRCIKCKRDHARKYRDSDTGREVFCKATRTYLTTDRGCEKHRQDAELYRERHPERVLQQLKQSRNTDHGRAVQRRGFFKREYDSTPEEYQRMFEAQKGQCKICGTPQSELSRRLDADHDLITGKTRGLLCRGCNNSLARFENGYPYGDVWTEKFEGYLGRRVKI